MNAPVGNILVLCRPISLLYMNYNEQMLECQACIFLNDHSGYFCVNRSLLFLTPLWKSRCGRALSDWRHNAASADIVSRHTHVCSQDSSHPLVTQVCPLPQFDLCQDSRSAFATDSTVDEHLTEIVVRSVPPFEIRNFVRGAWASELRATHSGISRQRWTGR